MLMETSVKQSEERLLLRIPEAAAKLGVSRSFLYQLVREDGLPVVRIKGSVRISNAALEAWVEHQSSASSHVSS